MPVADRVRDTRKAALWQPTFDRFYKDHYPDYGAHCRFEQADIQKSGIDLVLVTLYGRAVTIDEKVGSGYPDHFFIETIMDYEKGGFGGVGWFYTSNADELVIGKVKGDALDVYVLDRDRLDLYIRTHRGKGAFKQPKTFKYPDGKEIDTEGVLVPVTEIEHFGYGPWRVEKHRD